MSDAPLCDLAEQRDADEAAAAAEARAEICQRVTMVEDALAILHIGFDTVSGRVMRLVARAAGFGVLRRTMPDLACDRDVDCSRERVADVVRMLVADDLLDHAIEPEPPFRRRGRPPKIHRLSINWEHVRRIRRWEADRIERSKATGRGVSTDDFQMANQWPTNDRQTGNQWPTNDRQTNDQNSSIDTALYTQVPNPPPPPAKPAVVVESKRSDWTAAETAVRDAGVGQWSRVVDAAIENGYTPAELIDDAFVVRYCAKLGPGALLYRVRDRGRCWPESGIPDVETLRGQRVAKAAAIRDALATAAASEGVSTESAAFHARAFERLTRADLSDQTTAIERRAFDAIQSGRTRPTAPPEPKKETPTDAKPNRPRRRRAASRIRGESSGASKVVSVADALAAGGRR